MQVNPLDTVVPEPVATTAEEPPRKFKRLSTEMAITIAEAHPQLRHMEQQQQAAEADEKTVNPISFKLLARMQTFTEAAFEDNPLYEKDGAAKMRLLATVEDLTGKMEVTLWQPAISGCSTKEVETLMKLWQSCDDQHGRTAFLKCFNIMNRKSSLLCALLSSGQDAT